MTAILALALVINGSLAAASSKAERAEQGGISAVSDESRGSRGATCTYQIENGSTQLINRIEVQPGSNAAIPRAVLRDLEHQPEEWFDDTGLAGEPLLVWRGERADDVLRPGQRMALTFSVSPIAGFGSAGAGPAAGEFVCAQARVAISSIAELPTTPEGPAIEVAIVGIRFDPASRWLSAVLTLRNHGPDTTIYLGEEYSGERYAQQIELSATRSTEAPIEVRASILRARATAPVLVALPHGGSCQVSWSGYANQLEPGIYSVTARYRGAAPASPQAGSAGDWQGLAESHPARLYVASPAEKRQLARGPF